MAGGILDYAEFLSNSLTDQKRCFFTVHYGCDFTRNIFASLLILSSCSFGISVMATRFLRTVVLKTNLICIQIITDMMMRAL